MVEHQLVLMLFSDYSPLFLRMSTCILQAKISYLCLIPASLLLRLYALCRIRGEHLLQLQDRSVYIISLERPHEFLQMSPT